MHEKLRKLKSSKPKEYWNLLKPKKKTTNDSIDIKELYDHFKTLNESPDTNRVNFDPNNISIQGEGILNDDFTETEMNKLVKKLKNNKSNGIDNVINEFIKYSPSEYKLLILKLFNTVLKTGLMPKDWLTSFISPAFKNKGSKSDPNNYRGISLISCIGKLFTALINYRVTQFVEINIFFYT